MVISYQILPGLTYKCYHWSEEDAKINNLGGWSVQTERTTCENKQNFVFSQGDDSMAPGCGKCWCCQPANQHNGNKVLHEIKKNF